MSVRTGIHPAASERPVGKLLGAHVQLTLVDGAMVILDRNTEAVLYLRRLSEEAKRLALDIMRGGVIAPPAQPGYPYDPRD